MANEVEIRIKSKDDSKSGLQSAEKNIKGIGEAAEDAERSMDGLAGSANRLDSIVGKGGANFRQYGSDLDGVGDGFNDVEDRAMGAGNLITGFNDVMSGGDPATYAQGLSDMAAGMRYTIVPTFQDGIKSIKNMNIAMIGTVAGIGAIVAGTFLLNDAITEAKINDLTESFKKTRIAGDELNQALRDEAAGEYTENLSNLNRVVEGGVHDYDEMIGVVKKLAEESPALAQEYIDQADAAGLSAEGVQKLTDALDVQATSAEIAADKIRGVSDAILAQSDPTFAALDAMNQLADANQGIADAEAARLTAIAEFGAGSAEAIKADQDLQRAHEEAATAAFAQETAMLNLASEMQASGASVDDVIAHLQGLADQGYISQTTVDNVSNSLRNVPSSVETTLYANDLASVNIEEVKRNIGQIPREVVVNIRAQADLNRFQASRLLGNAHGGIIGAQSGGVRSNSILVGEHGPELVDLAPGSRVHGNAMTQGMLAGGGHGGGTTVNLYIGGSILSERQLVQIVRDEFDRGGLQGVRR